VRQGDPLSPKLFSAALESIFRKLNWYGFGLNINDRRLNHLRFADDIVLFEEHLKNLEDMIKELSTISNEVGLEINETKTMVMTNSKEVNISINNNPIGNVDEYVYLGQIISFSDQMTKEIDKRIANDWKKYWSLREIMKSTKLGIAIKRKTFDTCILPYLTYGCETWALTQQHREKLAKCQYLMERSMLVTKLKDKIRNGDIRSNTKVTDILKRVDQLKWRWTGHLIRCSQEKWSKQVTCW
jgi:hypothetical protein